MSARTAGPHPGSDATPDATPTSGRRRTRTLEPRTGWRDLGLGEAWAYRELLFFLTWRRVQVRYKQTLLGAAWAIIQPLVMMFAFTFLFGRVAVISTDGIPRPIFYYAALLPWTYFAQAVSISANSIVEGGRMITKVYFPRVLLPVASTLAGLLDFVLSFLVLVGLMVYFRIPPRLELLTLPGFAALAVISAAGAALWLAPLNAIFRDVRFLTSFLVQFGMFISPVIYPSSRVPENLLTLYYLNPMAGVVDGFRWAITGQAQPPLDLAAASAGVAVAVFVSGLWFFRRIESRTIDVV